MIIFQNAKNHQCHWYDILTVSLALNFYTEIFQADLISYVVDSHAL